MKIKKLICQNNSFFVYILFSEKLNQFYTGSTELLPQKRLEQHNSKFNKNSFTTKGVPWVLFHFIQCSSRSQARNVETHIKKMKSKQYIQNFKKYPEISVKLLLKFE